MQAATPPSEAIWSDADDRRLLRLVGAMFSFSKIAAEFPDRSANAVRGAWFRLLCDGLPPTKVKAWRFAPK